MQFICFLIPLVFIILILIFYLVLRTHLKTQPIIKFSKYQNGPKTRPFIGNLDTLFNKPIFELLIELKTKYSMPFNFWIWSDYYYATDIPQEIKAVLCNSKKSFSKAPFYDDVLKAMFGKTFIMTPISEIQRWKTERNIVVKALAPSMWPFYIPVLNDKAKKLVKSLQTCDDFNTFSRFTSQFVFETFLENFLDVGAEVHGEYLELHEAVNEMMDVLTERSVTSKIMPQWYWKYFMEDGRRYKFLYSYIEEKFKEIVLENRRRLSDTDKPPNKFKFLERMILNKEINFTDSDIARQILLMYVTSVETTVLTLSYILAYLGMHPEIQGKIYKEVIDQVGEKDISQADSNNLKYLEQAILETLRILPIGPIAGRHVTDDIDLGHKVIPKGANVAVIPYLVHRNEKYWPNPETFDPDRFSHENASTIPMGSYIPFLIGSRDCLGKYYSLIQLKIFAAHILRNYKVIVDPKDFAEIRFKHFILARPNKNFDMEFVPRK